MELYNLTWARRPMKQYRAITAINAAANKEDRIKIAMPIVIVYHSSVEM
jgi:hypothetical protein